MKLECHILSTDDTGDRLLLKLQGWGVSDPEDQFCAGQELRIPNDARSRRTFYVGRRVTIDIKPA